MMFVADACDPLGLVSRYVPPAMAPGSYLSLSHATGDAKPPAAVEGLRLVFDDATERLYFRSKTEVARFFDGLELVAPHPGARPGLTHAGVWGAESAELAEQRRVAVAVLPEVARVSWRQLGGARIAKPTPADLGIDPSAVTWERSRRGRGLDRDRHDGAGRLDTHAREAGMIRPWRILLFDRTEWEVLHRRRQKGRIRRRHRQFARPAVAPAAAPAIAPAVAPAEKRPSPPPSPRLDS